MKLKITEHIEIAVDEMAKLQGKLSDWSKNPVKTPFAKNEISVGTYFGDRLMSQRGAEHLWLAASALLKRQKLDARISKKTAHDLLDKEIGIELERLKANDRFSFEAITKRTSDALQRLSYPKATHLYPAIITGRSFPVDERIGPVRLLSRDAFDDEYASIFAAALTDDAHQDRLFHGWKEYTEEYSYFLTVTIDGYEDEMARNAGREASEWFLNLIRLRVGRRDGSRIRLAGGKRFDQQSASLSIMETGKVSGRLNFSARGAVLEDDWATVIFEELRPLENMLSTVASRFVRGDARGEPVFERIHYANQLLTEAFADTSDRMRLVKFVAAFEALAVLPRDAKADTLARRCALAISISVDDEYVSKAEHLVKQAYATRNAVVHGDAPDPATALRALYDLEPYLQTIVLHLLRMLITVKNQHEPQSIRPLRRFMKQAYDELELSQCP